MKRVLVTGAGGFIGHHLVSYLKAKNCWVRGVDIEHPEFEISKADEFLILDLRRWENCLEATKEVEEVYALAADMGGMGFISSHHAQILHNNSLINIHTLDAARENSVKRYLYTSSACIYPEYKQTETNVVPLKEEDAYPAQPQDAYGWEKLVSERLCTHYREDYGIETGSFVSITSSDLWELGMGGEKRRLPRCAGKWPWPSSPATPKSRSGGTANRLGPFAISMTV